MRSRTIYPPPETLVRINGGNTPHLSLLPWSRRARIPLKQLSGHSGKVGDRRPPVRGVRRSEECSTETTAELGAHAQTRLAQPNESHKLGGNAAATGRMFTALTAIFSLRVAHQIYKSISPTINPREAIFRIVWRFFTFQYDPISTFSEQPTAPPCGQKHSKVRVGCALYTLHARYCTYNSVFKG